MQNSGYKKIRTSVDEFVFVMKNLDSWERMMNLKFVEADLEGGNVTLMVNPVASTGFYYWVDKGKGKSRLMAELIRDTRVGYIELEEFADFDKELLNELKHRLVDVENHPDCERCFPKTSESVSLFHRLMRTAKWKRT